jgi:acetyl esterase/lipase
VGSIHPPYDAELAPVVESVAGSGAMTITLEALPALRDNIGLFVPSDDTLRRGGAVELEPVTFPGAQSELDLDALLLRPAGGVTSGVGVLYIHGGGMVTGNHRFGLEEVAAWVEELGVVALSIDYRLAPEHPHPTPVEDCYAGLVWARDHAADLGFDAGRLLVAGVSAGGGLAAGVALLARDRLLPPILGQILLEPMLDDRLDTPSSFELDGDGIWDRQANLVGWTALLGDARGGPDVSPYAAPARAEDLSGLAPAYLDVGSVEVFRDEVVSYAARIWQAGGTAELHVWSGGFHGFDLFAPGSALAQEAAAARVNWIRRLTRP